MANLHHVSTSDTVGKVTIQIRGKSSCQVSDLNHLAFLLAEVMNDLAFEGEYTVTPQRRALPGSASQKGLSVNGTNHNLVGIGFQPGGNATRARYDLHTADAQNVFRILKDYIGTAYNGRVTPKAKLADQQKPLVAEVKVRQDALVIQVAKPTEAPLLYYTKDVEWMETTVLLLSDMADEHPEHHVTKDQVLDLIVQRTHLANRGGTAPIYLSFMVRGYLVPIDSAKDAFKLVETPPADFKAHGLFKRKPKPVSKEQLNVSATQAQPKVKLERKQKYLSDEEWMRSFMEGLQSLVTAADGLVSKTDLHVFIKERTNQKKIASTVYVIVEGLKNRGWVSDAGGKFYRLVYEPKPDTLEKAVKGIEQARAEKTKVFEGFAKTRLPTFAEGMFSKKQMILDDFLRLAGAGATHVSGLRSWLFKQYPVSDRSLSILVNYMKHNGYLVERKKGMYALGPTGRERLGLSPVEYKIVEKTVSIPPEVLLLVAPVVTLPDPKPSVQAFVPAGLLLTPQPEANASKADPAVTLVIAKAVRDIKQIEQEADEAEAQQAELEARNAELKAKQAEPQGDVDAEAQRRMIAMLV